MGKKKKHKKTQPKETKPHFIEKHWQKIVIIALFILPFIYFGSFLFNSNKMIAGSDFLVEAYPYEKWTAELEGMPLFSPNHWQPNIMGGFSQFSKPFGGPLRFSSQFREFFPPHIVLAWAFVVLFFLAGLGTYLYLKEIGLSQYTAAIGAFIYQFSGNLATTPDAGHMARAVSFAMLPLLLFFVHRSLTSKKLLYFLSASLITVFILYEGNFQVSFYGLMFISAYMIYYLVIHRRENSKKDWVKTACFGLIALVLIASQMLVIYLPVLSGLGTAARGVERGYAYATSWALPWREIVDLVIPTYSGILENYWGFNNFKLHLEYFGLFSIIFAIFALILCLKKPYVKFFLITIIITIVIALGKQTPLFRIFYTVFFFAFSKFRAPALIFYLTTFSFVVLGSIGFENMFIKKYTGKEKDIFQKRFLMIGGMLFAIFFITCVYCTAGGDSIIQSMQESLGPKLIAEWGQRVAELKMSNIRTNYPAFTSGMWRTLFFLFISFGIIYLSIKKEIKLWIFAAVFISLNLVDQLPLMLKFLPSGPGPEVYYAADEAVRYIKRDKDIFRVFPTPWYQHATDNYLLYHNLQSAGGYGAIPSRQYQKFIGAGTSVMFRPMNLLQYQKFLDMLNIKYIIGPTLPDDVSRYSVQDQKTISDLKAYFSTFALVFKGQRISVFFNDSLLPRAYIVPQYRVVDQSEVLNIMESSEFDHRRIVILEEEPDVVLSNDDASYAPVTIEDYGANEINCVIDNSHAGFLVFSDNWHPDWKVFVDGKEQKLYRANYTFRAVYVPAGKHEVVFKYISPHFNTGKIISIIVLILSVGLCVFIIAQKKSS